MKKNICNPRVTTLIVACSIFFNGCSNTEIENKPEVDKPQIVSENEHPAGIETVYVDEEYQKEIDKYAEEQIEVEKEKDASLTDYSDSDKEVEKNSIWQEIYNSAVWSSYSKSPYFSGNVDWGFSDMGDYISIISTYQGKMTEIMYYKYTSMIDITITDTETGYEVESYIDPRIFQTHDFSTNTSFDKMRLIITADNFGSIDNMYITKDYGDDKYRPSESEKHEADEAVFVIDNVAEGEQFSLVTLATQQIENVRFCAVVVAQ